MLYFNQFELESFEIPFLIEHLRLTLKEKNLPYISAFDIGVPRMALIVTDPLRYPDNEHAYLVLLNPFIVNRQGETFRIHNDTDDEIFNVYESITLEWIDYRTRLNLKHQFKALMAINIQVAIANLKNHVHGPNPICIDSDHYGTMN